MKNEYQVITCEADTGIIVDCDGMRITGAADDKLPVCSSLAEAEVVRDGFLAKVPWGEVVIKNLSSGETTDPVHGPQYQDYEREKKALAQWVNTPLLLRLFRKKPDLKILAQQTTPRWPRNAPP